MKNVPQRTCMGCNTKKDQTKLIRITKNKENKISIDKTAKTPGRGAYICNNIDCLEKVIKNKRLERVLKTKISEEVYKDLRGVIIDKQ